METWHRVGPPKGESTGWPELDEFYKVRRGEWTLVTGIPGHGKSELLDAMLVNLATRGWRFGLFTQENKPYELHVAKLAEKFVGKPFCDLRDRDGSLRVPKMGANELALALDWMKSRVWYIEPPEMTLESVLAQAKMLVLRKKVHGVIVDPWNEVEHAVPSGMNETQYTSRALSRIRRFARSLHVHVWLVAHPTKMKKERDDSGKMVYPPPTPYDVSGSAHFRNKADNCLCVYRTVGEGSDDQVQVLVQKVRNKVVGKVGYTVLTYFNESGDYKDRVQCGEAWDHPIENMKRKLGLKGDAWVWAGFTKDGRKDPLPEEESPLQWVMKGGALLAQDGGLEARVRKVDGPPNVRSVTYFASVRRDETDFWEEEFTAEEGEVVRELKLEEGQRVRLEVLDTRAKRAALDWAERRMMEEGAAREARKTEGGES